MGQLVGAHSDRGHPEAGDQTGTEVSVSNYHNGNWNCLIRHKDTSVATKAAAIAVKLAKSNLVGYSQGNRTTLKNELAACGWDVDKYIASGKKSCADCSSFVHICYAVVVTSLRDVYPCTTGSIPTTFASHGFTVTYKSMPSSQGLITGDIVDRTSGHVEMYVENADSLPSDVGGSGSGSGSTTQIEFDPKDAILREVAYLTNDLSPSINKTKTLLSLYNTAIFKQILDSASNGDVSYNIDGLQGNCKTIVKYLIDKGLNLAAAIGVAANIQRESNFRTDAVNPSSGASGICQWYDVRRTRMINYVGSDWRTNLSRQLDYLWLELNENYYRHVLDYLKTVQDTLAGAKQAMDYFLKHFEVPGNHDSEYRRRETFVEDMWGKCSIIQKPSSSGTTNGVVPSGNPVKTVEVPSSVNQSGLIPNYTNYGYWFSRWAWTQRKIADEWASTGRNHIEYVASIAGYRLLACSTVFGTTGDLIKVNLQDGTSFGAIIADSKGGDAGSKWGHILGGKVDIIEWEMAGTSSSAVDSATQAKMKLTGLRNKKVKSISNYGQYKKW